MSNLIFGLLLLRWLRRHMVWALLLCDLARLELKLVANHPDDEGRLRCIAETPAYCPKRPRSLRVIRRLPPLVPATG